MDRRDIYVEKLKARLDEWNAELNKAEAKARGAEADVRLRYDEGLEHMRSKRDEARQHLHEIEEAGEESWERLRRGFEQAWEDIRTGFERARDRFRQ